MLQKKQNDQYNGDGCCALSFCKPFYVLFILTTQSRGNDISGHWKTQFELQITPCTSKLFGMNAPAKLPQVAHIGRDDMVMYPTPPPGRHMYDSLTWQGVSSATTALPPGYHADIANVREEASDTSPPQPELPAADQTEEKKTDRSTIPIIDIFSKENGEKVGKQTKKTTVKKEILVSSSTKTSSRTFTRTDEEELVAYWSEHHMLFNGKHEKKFLQGAVTKLNQRYKNDQKFTVAKIRKKCDYMKDRFNNVRDQMKSS